MTGIDTESLSMHELSVFIWAGLYHEDRDLTPEKVMDLVDDYSDIPTASLALGEAVTQAFGEKKDNDEKNEMAAESGAGKSS